MFGIKMPWTKRREAKEAKEAFERAQRQAREQDNQKIYRGLVGGFSHAPLPTIQPSSYEIDPIAAGAIGYMLGSMGSTPSRDAELIITGGGGTFDGGGASGDWDSSSSTDTSYSSSDYGSSDSSSSYSSGD